MRSFNEAACKTGGKLGERPPGLEVGLASMRPPAKQAENLKAAELHDRQYKASMRPPAKQAENVLLILTSYVLRDLASMRPPAKQAENVVHLLWGPPFAALQ